jgi:DNA-binding transcriptional ArsR family regulator
MDTYDNSAKLFKALMHPARLEILDILRDGEHCVCHIEAALGYRQAYISQQLSVLREAGLVQDRRDGWNVHYRVVQPQVFALLDVAITMVGGQPSRRYAGTAGQPSKRRIVNGAGLDNCPCPRCASAETVAT